VRVADLSVQIEVRNWPEIVARMDAAREAALKCGTGDAVAQMLGALQRCSAIAEAMKWAMYARGNPQMRQMMRAAQEKAIHESHKRFCESAGRH
jgi:hypothetical protein